MADAPSSISVYSFLNVLLGLIELPAAAWLARGGYYGTVGGTGIFGLIILYFPLAYIGLGLLAGWRRSSKAFLALVAHNGFVTLVILYWWYIDPAGFGRKIGRPILLGVHLLALVLAIRARSEEPRYVSYSG